MNCFLVIWKNAKTAAKILRGLHDRYNLIPRYDLPLPVYYTYTDDLAQLNKVGFVYIDNVKDYDFVKIFGDKDGYLRDRIKPFIIDDDIPLDVFDRIGISIYSQPVVAETWEDINSKNNNPYILRSSINEIDIDEGCGKSLNELLAAAI